ncbi:hypothetical protein APA_1128 [Pseudanabaena sp. lw0831]|nr:hypothetical protein APA_1128 [Pseudanabaena sp. lw0831]
MKERRRKTPPFFHNKDVTQSVTSLLFVNLCNQTLELAIA